MYHWFESYDADTYMVPFIKNNFARYNPFSKDNTFFTAAIKGSQSFEMILI
jgi:hypothetical protein